MASVSEPMASWVLNYELADQRPNPVFEPRREARPLMGWRARVEVRIRCGKTTGFGRFPSRHFAIDQAWLELALTAIDLLAWTQTLLLHGELATAEPKKLRYCLLHAAARLTRGGRRIHLRIAATWSWRSQLTTAFTRLAALSRPAT